MSAATRPTGPSGPGRGAGRDTDDHTGSASVTVRIPAQIRRLYGAQAWEQIPATCVGDVIAELERRYPGMGERLSEPDGALRRWVNIFVNGEDVRNLAGPATPLAPGVEVQIVPSVAGG